MMLRILNKDINMRSLLLVLILFNTYVFSATFNEFINNLESLPQDQRSAVVKEFLKTKGTLPVIENDTTIYFIWFGKANSVLITGDLQNGWGSQDTLMKKSCGEENFFYKTYLIPSDSRMNYVFIVDGQYKLDEANPRIAATASGPNSEAVMPKFINNPILNFRSEIAHGSLDSLTFASKDTSLKSRQIEIYIPAGYENLSDLPSVYVFNGFEALKFGEYKNVLDNLIADKSIVPIIAIFIQPVDAMDEFANDKRRNFSNAVCNELVPLIDGSYKTSKDPMKRAMMGNSYSGNLAFSTVLEHTDLFLNVASQSLIERWLRPVLESESGKKVFPKELKAYIDYGIFEYNGPQGNLISSIRSISGAIKSYGIKHPLVVYHDGHSWQNWRRHTDEILKYFFAKNN